MRTLTAEDGSNPLLAIQARLGKAMLEAEERHRAEVERLRESHSKEARAMQGQVGELRKEIARYLEREDADERVAEEAERGTAKGRSFEELVHDTIDAIAQAQGDAAHHTGDTTNESGSKKGDTVVEIGGALGAPLATIVFEAKNKRLSKNDAWTELNSCMGQRDASFAVLVVAGEDKVPAGLEELTEYQGNKIIAVLDREDPDPLALRLVYRYVRARVLAAGADQLEVDAAGVRDAAEEAAARLKRANRVRKSLTSVTNSAKAAGDEFDEMVADIERCLARIEGLVAAAAEDAESCPKPGLGQQQVVLRALALGSDGELRLARRRVRGGDRVVALLEVELHVAGALRDDLGCSTRRSGPRGRASSGRRSGWRS